MTVNNHQARGPKRLASEGIAAAVLASNAGSPLPRGVIEQ